MVQLAESRASPDAQLQHQLAELFLETEEQVLVDFLQAIEESSLRQVVHRLRLALHPDKNSAHPRAGEAFSRMTHIT